MQAQNELSGWQRWVCRQLWLKTRLVALAAVWLMCRCGLHKQIANRILEPWMWITVIATANKDGWANFFHLRCSEFAEPHIRKIAEMCREAMEKSTPQLLNEWIWHLPLVGFDGDEKFDTTDQIKLSVGRCARVSYLTHDGRRDPQKDIKLHDSLMKNGHWSPFEHAAKPAEQNWGKHRNRGGNLGPKWIQYRKLFPGEMTKAE
jgi:hypothetical protein